MPKFQICQSCERLAEPEGRFCLQCLGARAKFWLVTAVVTAGLWAAFMFYVFNRN